MVKSTKSPQKTRVQPPRRVKQEHVDEDAVEAARHALNTKPKSTRKAAETKPKEAKKPGRKKAPLKELEGDESGYEGDQEKERRRMNFRGSGFSTEFTLWVFLSVVAYVLGWFCFRYFDVMGWFQQGAPVRLSDGNLNFSDEYLRDFRKVYGSYGLTTPDLIPRSVSIGYLKNTLSKDTPLLSHYGSLGKCRTHYTPEFENEWDDAFTESYEESGDEDKSKAVLEALYQSDDLEGVKEHEGSVNAYSEAVAYLEKEGKMSVGAVRRVHAALHFGAAAPGDEKDMARNNAPGNFRGRLTGADTVSGNVASHPFEIPGDVEKLSAYFNEQCRPLPERSLSYASCVLHWYLHYMHVKPFADGNGRTGRVWVAALLARKQLPPMDLGEYTDPPTDAKRYEALFEMRRDVKGGTVAKDEFWYDHLRGIIANAKSTGL